MQLLLQLLPYVDARRAAIFVMAAFVANTNWLLQCMKTTAVASCWRHLVAAAQMCSV